MTEEATWADQLPDVIRGCWQLSASHGSGWTRSAAFEALDQAESEDGPLVLDLADIYTGVEDLVGDWLRERPRRARAARVHTKFVPDLSALPSVDRRLVKRSIHRSLGRLGVEALDLVQFHWWDFAHPGWIDAAGWLVELRKAGDIKQVGVTNFDGVRLGQLLDAGVPVVSNQVQLSLLDRRPSGVLSTLCEERGVALLCYGTLAGGLLTERWLGTAWPKVEGVSRSLAKYRAVVDEVGGWDALQSLLVRVARVSRETGKTFAQIGAAYARHQPGVGAVIVGLSRGEGRAPWGVLEPLSPAHIAALEAALPRSVQGAVYQLERVKEGPHGRLMNYELGRQG